MTNAVIDDAVQAIRTGRPVVLPFDTVYGLAAEPYLEESTRRLYKLKGRDEAQPSALVASSVDFLFECVPELRGRAGTLARLLLPGPVTLILPNPARRFPWITGPNKEAIGVRVPLLEGPGRSVLERVGAVVATSANHPGEPDPGRSEDVPEDIRSGAAAVVDGGELPGTPSTVIDLREFELDARWSVMRAGAVSRETIAAALA
jgi:L-threonylcarbamoyladenylate synthase